MAKPSWATVTPTNGSGNSTTNVSGLRYMGRLQRSGALTYKATGVTDVSQPLNQEGRTEYVSVENVSSPKSGGNVTITGKTNSSKLQFALGAGDITMSLPVSYTAGGVSTSNNVAIAGDPGAGGEVGFSMVVSIPANVTTATKTRAVTVTASGGQTATSVISQAAGDPALSVSPNTITLNADGDAVTVNVTSNTNWTVE